MLQPKDCKASPPEKDTPPKAGDPFAFIDLDGKTHRLTLEQRLFCEKYVELRGCGAAAVRAAGYAVKNSKVAKAIAFENLTKPYLLRYIKFLLEGMGLTNESVDLELLWIIQQNANLSAKVQGIREYNRMRGRATEKMQYSVDERLEAALDKIAAALP